MPSFEDLKISPVKNGRYTTTCPQCSHLRKAEHKKVHCLTVNNEVGNRWYNCSHCNAFSGNLDIMERFDEVYKKARMPKVRPTLFSPDVQGWLDLKQISAATALRLGCYEIKTDIEGKTHAIAYPYYWRKTLRNVMFRKPVASKGDASGPREWQINKEAGTESIFWGLDELDLESKNEVIITEGQTDRMTWYEVGYSNVLSLPMGGIAPNSRNNEKKLEFLNKEFMDLTKDVARFILAVDNDEVGKHTEAILANALGPERCFRVVYPYKYKDTNEVWAGDVGKDLEPRRKKGVDELYQSAKPYPIAGIIRLRDVSAEVRILAEDGLKKGFVTGLKTWDDHLSLREKLMVVVTGIPKMGKSTFWRDYSVKQCRNNDDMKWAMYTPESRPMRREYLKLMENYAGMGSNPKWKNSMSMEQYKAAERWVDERYILIAPENKNFYNFNKKDTKPKTLDNLFDYFKTLKRNEGIFGFSIDAWNKIDHQRPSGISETDFISRELDRVLEFCDVHSMCGVIIAHPAKQEKIAGNNYEIPTMYDIKGSSAWNEKADIGISIHRYKNVNQNENIKGAKPLWRKNTFAPTICSVLAVRFDELAKEGEFETFMDWRKGDRFYEDKRPWMVEQEQSGKSESKADMEHDEAVLGGLANKPDLFTQDEPQAFDEAPF